MIYTLIHNPRCSKSRQAKELLEQRELDFKIREYLKIPFDKDELVKLYQILGTQQAKIIRTKEKEYKDAPFDLDNKDLVIAALMKFPNLLERPILSDGAQAVIGRPMEQITDFLVSKRH